MSDRIRLVLGSSSPRRLELLSRAGLVPDEIRAPYIDEDPLPRETPLAYCRRIAQSKSDSLTVSAGEAILTADTTVALGRRILGKPIDANEAAEFMSLLSGRRHRVITSICVRSNRRCVSRSVTSTVRMRRLTGAEIDAYIATDEWQGKAGAYAIQGMAETFIPWIQGSHSAIVGLPLCETVTLLGSFGVYARRQQ